MQLTEHRAWTLAHTAHALRPEWQPASTMKILQRHKDTIPATNYLHALQALITYATASDLFYPGTHGSTFGGNALGTAVSNAVLAEIGRADLVANAAERGAELQSAILGIGSDLVEGCRGRGLLIGVALRHPVARAVVAAAQERGLIVNAPNDATIRLVPALNIGDVEIDEFTALFAASLAAVAASLPEGVPA